MRRTSSAMAGSVDNRTKLTVTVILNLILIGFYYAFGGTEAAVGLSVLSAVAVFFILINSCAFPFTQAAFISRFTGRNDYKSVLYVRMVSMILTMSVSVFFALILIIASGPVSGLILGFTNAAKDQLLIRLCLIFGALYGVACAWVSWLRGFWQGMGEMKIDERSQMISSVSFYIFSFIIMIILVHGFHLNRSFAAMGAAGGLLLSQALTGGFLTLYDTMKIKKLQKMAKAQMIPAMTKKKVFSELLQFTVPSGITSLIFGLMIMIPVFMAVYTAMAYRVKAVDAEKILALYGALIPAVTMVTLPVAQNCGDINIPKLAETSWNRQKEKTAARIERITTMYTANALPLSFTIACLAEQILAFLYGQQLALGSSVYMICGAAQGFLLGGSWLVTQMMLTMGYGNSCIAYALIAAAANGVLFWLLPASLGAAGLFAASVLALAVFCFLCMAKISNRRSVSFLTSLVMTLRIVLACLAVNGIYALAKYFGLFALSSDRLFSGLILAGVILAGFAVCYFILTISGIRLTDSRKKKKE